MVVDLAQRTATDRVLHALSDATRRDIVEVVLRSEHSVSNLARRYPMSFAAVQKHVAVLESAELITKRTQGREKLVRGNIDTVRAASQLFDRLEQIWRDRIDRMHDLLDEPDPKADASDDRDPDHHHSPNHHNRGSA